MPEELETILESFVLSDLDVDIDSLPEDTRKSFLLGLRMGRRDGFFKGLEAFATLSDTESSPVYH